jgi:hypothetical protein
MPSRRTARRSETSCSGTIGLIDVDSRKENRHIYLRSGADQATPVIAFDNLTGDPGVHDEVPAISNLDLSWLALEVAKQH